MSNPPNPLPHHHIHTLSLENLSPLDFLTIWQLRDKAYRRKLENSTSAEKKAIESLHHQDQIELCNVFAMV